jgi:hypothetical protein
LNEAGSGFIVIAVVVIRKSKLGLITGTLLLVQTAFTSNHWSRKKAYVKKDLSGSFSHKSISLVKVIALIANSSVPLKRTKTFTIERQLAIEESNAKTLSFPDARSPVKDASMDVH